MNNMSGCAIVTGAGGFLGKRLVKLLDSKGMCVVTMGTSAAKHSFQHICLDDVANHWSILRHLESLKTAPKWIFHLAGCTEGKDIYKVNYLWGKAILDACDALADKPSVLLVGTAAEYGPQIHNHQSRYGYCISEESTCSPVSEYGKTKYLQTCYALSVSRRHQVVVARPFNIIGAGMPVTLALGSFVAQAKSLPSVSSGFGRYIYTGPLHAVRDFVDVDACSSMLLDLIMNPEATGKVVNVCSGVGTSMRDVVQVLIKLLDPPVTLVEKPIENPLEDVFVGSVDRLRHLGLKPSVCNLSFCIQNMLES